MKRICKRIFLLILCISNFICAAACSAETPHTCSFAEQVIDSKYLKVAATCQAPAEYFYSCSCGEIGEMSFSYGEALSHDFSVADANNASLKSDATCQTPAEYFYSCSCGEIGETYFVYGEALSHDFSVEDANEASLKTAATCQAPAEYFHSCSCGEIGETYFVYGDIGNHDFSVKDARNANLKAIANCQSPAEYYYTCSHCGKKGDVTFAYGECTEHQFIYKIIDEKHLKCQATTSSPALYYFSCFCEAVGTETFEHGDRLLTDEEKEELLAPKSLTVTLYDAPSSVYGFTFNTLTKPIKTVIQIRKSTDSVWSEYSVSSTRYNSYDANNVKFDYYISKAEIMLEPDTSYVYRIYNKDNEKGADEISFETKNPDDGSFTFAHVSDTQDGANAFKNVLSSVSNTSDFIIHTGDVVQYSKYEYLWEQMLDGNSEYISRIPIMAISGNHETNFTNCGTQETYKHFNNKIPDQESTARGYFYSFTYGNVKFIMLNTNDLSGNKLKDEQYDWLVQELSTNTCKWTVVAMHNPLYSVGKYGSTPNTNTIALSLQEQLQGIFAQYGVDIVLQGHDHAISRTKPINENGEAQSEVINKVNGINYVVDPNGVIYVMNGTAGTQCREPVSSADASLYAYFEGSDSASWAEFTFDGDYLTVTVKRNDDGFESVYQTWGIYKTAKNV